MAPKKKNIKKRFPLASTVGHYMMAKKKLKGRPMARALDIHHRTWQDYLAGRYGPGAATRKRMVALMKVESFEELVRLAIRYYRGLI